MRKEGNQKSECGGEINTILNEGIRWINTMIPGNTAKKGRPCQMKA